PRARLGVGSKLIMPRGHAARTIALQHGEGAVNQVAEPIGQFSVVPCSKARIGPVAIGPKVQFAADKITESVHSPFVNNGDGIDNVSGCLADFLAIFLPPT